MLTLMPRVLVGFRVLKKTLESPYTTKLNYRGRTTRGTTQIYDIEDGER